MFVKSVKCRFQVWPRKGKSRPAMPSRIFGWSSSSVRSYLALSRQELFIQFFPGQLHLVLASLGQNTSKSLLRSPSTLTSTGVMCYLLLNNKGFAQNMILRCLRNCDPLSSKLTPVSSTPSQPSTTIPWLELVTSPLHRNWSAFVLYTISEVRSDFAP